MTRAKSVHQWTMTPMQAMLGRRVGFRNHWKHWATGLTCAFVAGSVSGIKIGHHMVRRRTGSTSPQPG